VPKKIGGVISPSEARALLRDPSTMKIALVHFQVEAGDRAPNIPRVFDPQQKEKGFRHLSDREWDQIGAIVRKLADAIRSQAAPPRRP
jgi:hypothetical protein